jgi:hypothetical protein
MFLSSHLAILFTKILGVILSPVMGAVGWRGLRGLQQYTEEGKPQVPAPMAFSLLPQCRGGSVDPFWISAFMWHIHVVVTTRVRAITL